MSDHCGVLSQIYVSLPPGGKSIPGIFLLLP
jgi:hypothetical protein